MNILLSHGQFIVLAATALYCIWKIWSNLPRTISYKDSDGFMLSAAEMLSRSKVPLASGAKGKVAGFDYNLMYNGERIFAYVQLGFVTNIHVIVVGDKSLKLLGGLGRNPWLSQVKLEGDFPDYFRIYCSKGREMELLQLFEPDTMAYFVDLCRAYNLEIYQDTVYMSQGSRAVDDKDNTPMLADVEKFLTDQQQTLRRFKEL
jgi:hypothetical protein